MSQREKILAIAVACLAVAFGARYLYGKYDRAYAAGQSQLIAANDELGTLKLSLRQGERAVKQMEHWRQLSLPANREKALSLYKAWLLAKAKGAGLTVDDIQPAPQVARPALDIRAIGYRMQASGSLPAVVGMLYEFYRTPQLHQVTQLQLMRPVGASQLQVTFQAEALLLPGANATESVPEGESKRLKLASLAEYQKSLGDRDLASVYTPPRPVTAAVKKDTPPAPPKFDDAEQAYFTGSSGVGDSKQAWINVRTTGETLMLSAGDPLKVGALEGKIVSIELRAIVWQSGEKKYRVPLGESLRKGTELGAEIKDASREKAERSES